MLKKSIRVALNARAELRLHPGSQGYFLPFFDFLAFFAFFAFFAFLAIVSSQGLMDGNATPRHAKRRASLATSSTLIQQIRGVLPPSSPQCHPLIHSCYAFLPSFHRAARARSHQSLPQ